MVSEAKMITAEQALNAGRKYTNTFSGGYKPPPKPQGFNLTQSVAGNKTAQSGFKLLGSGFNFASNINKSINKIPIIGNVKQGVERKASAGLGAFGKVLSVPIGGFGGFLSGTRRESERLAARGENPFTGIPKAAFAGIKNIPTGIRQNYTPGRYLADDVLKIKNDPLLRASAMLGTDLVSDPLNYVNPFSAIAKVGRAAQVPKLVSKANTAARTVPKVNTALNFASRGGNDLLGLVKYGHGVPAPALRAFENLNIRGQQKVKNIVQDIAGPLISTKGNKIPVAVQKQIGDVFEILSGGSNRALTASEQAVVKKYAPLFQRTAGKFEKLAGEQVKYGIPSEIFDKYLGKYTGKRSYLSTLGKKREVSPFAEPKQPRLNLENYQKRQDLPVEVREAMEQIKEPGYGAATAAFNEASNVQKLKFYRSIAKRYATREVGEGIVKLPKNTKLGVLSGASVPARIAEMVNQVANPTKGNKLVKFFKEGKTILSPKQLVRNSLSSQIQAYLNPSGRSDSFRRIPEAVQQLRTKGKYYQEARKAGVVGTEFASTELGRFAPEGVKIPTKFLGSTKAGKVYEQIKRPGAWVQNNNEEMVKLQVFINERKAGKTVAQAANAAEETGFNYQKVTPFINDIRRGTKIGETTALKNRLVGKIPGIRDLPFSIPFATYGVKAAELSGKTLLKKPQRMSRIIHGERAVESMSEDEAPNEAYMPKYQRGAVRLPMKDKKGNSRYLNTKYLYPWGSLADTGSFGLPFGQSPDPFFSELVSQIQNKDIFTGREVATKPGSKGVAQRIRHGAETFLPTPLRSGLKMSDSATKKPRYSTSPSLGEAALQELGLPLFKYDPALGASINSYKKSELLRKYKSEMKKELLENVGNPDEQRRIREYYRREIQKVASKPTVD